MKSKAPVPAVGRPARGSRSGRPIMVVFDLLGRRGALRILWELRHGTPLTFRGLLEAAATNPGLLNTRLRELRSSGIVGHEGEGYELTRTGQQLLAALLPLADWAAKWGEEQAAGVPAARRRRA